MSPQSKALFLSILQKTPHFTYEASFDDRPICVLDTNVILDLWLFKDAQTTLLQQYIDTKKLRLVAHEETFCELADVLSRSCFKLTHDEQLQLLMRFINHVEFLQGDLLPDQFCRDSDDNKFFALAKITSAKWLVSKDKKVLKARGKAKKFGTTVLNIEKLTEILTR